MPPFFENCLPEGWTESVVLASNKISREDLFGLLSTTRRYLSNLTLRPLGIPDEELTCDAHSVRMRDLASERERRRARAILRPRQYSAQPDRRRVRVARGREAETSCG